MCKLLLKFFLFTIVSTLVGLHVKAQNEPIDAKDTFFLVKKKGLLGKLGKSIVHDPPQTGTPVKIANPYLQFAGKVIRHIDYLSLGFKRDINDTNVVEHSFGVKAADFFHKNTRPHIIKNNLFFAEGERVFPYVVADNERYLRQQEYLKDARILIELSPGTIDSVDITVVTRDVFSIGGSLNLSGTDRGNATLKEENLAGTGSRLTLAGLYDKQRNPEFGYGAELLRRNIKGSFVDWDLGFTTFDNAFNSGRKEETVIYTNFEKPLVSNYMPWTGAVELAYKKTSNVFRYITDSFYRQDFKYTYVNTDVWFGYNFGTKRFLYRNTGMRTRKFIAVRGIYQQFSRTPDKYNDLYNYNYANVTGALASFSVFRQDYYRTNFIYGFGRNEDVPEGFSTTATAGWTDKSGRKRPYYGLDAEYNYFSTKGFYTTYVLKTGGYYYNKRFEDLNILAYVQQITKLARLNDMWFNRFFFNIGFTKQVNPLLDPPLYLQSQYGLPYFANGELTGDFRGIGRVESVFFNMKKYIGFRLAPFIFGDVCLLKHVALPLNKSDLFYAVGGGVRTRNENLTFGTLELRGYVFPRKSDPNMRSWKVEFTGNIKFKYISDLVHKPDFIVPN